MLSSSKQRQLYSSAHPVANGRLESLVGMVQESVKLDPEIRPNLERSKSRKKPTPLRVHGLSTSPGPQSCPVAKCERYLPAIPRIPTTPPSTIKQHVCPASAASDGTTRITSPYHLWEKCKDNPWLNTNSRKNSPFTVPTLMEQEPPVELPGSILLPSPDLIQRYSPSNSCQLNKLLRQQSPSTSAVSPPSLTHSCSSTPEPQTGLQPAFIPPTQKDHASQVTEFSKSRTKLLSLMNIGQLLEILPEIETREFTEVWMSAMKKEFAKLRGYILSFDFQDTLYKAGLHSFCEEIHHFLKVAKNRCENPDGGHKNTHELTDQSFSSEISKIMDVHDRLCNAVPSLAQYCPHKDHSCSEVSNIRATLLDCIQALSDFVRNQITFRIRHLCGGLSNGLAKAINEFDREYITGQRHAPLEIAAGLDSQPKKGSHSQRREPGMTSPELSKSTSVPMAPFIGRARIVQVNSRKAEAPLAYVKPTYIEQQANEESQIIDSYLDQRPASDPERLAETSSSSEHGNCVIAPDESANATHGCSQPQMHQQPSSTFYPAVSASQSTIPREAPLSIKPVLSGLSDLNTTSKSPPLQPVSVYTPPPSQHYPLSSSPDILSTSSPAPNYDYITLSPEMTHSLHTSPSYPPPEVTDVYLKLDKLEAQNNLLRTTIELLTRQVQRVEAGILSPVVGTNEATRMPRSRIQRQNSANRYATVTPNGIGNGAVALTAATGLGGGCGEHAMQRPGGVWM